MSYSAEISRLNPSCFLFLIDQSYSMTDQFFTGEIQMPKANGVSDAINKLLQNLVIKCSKDEGVRDYYNIGVIGYGQKVTPAFGANLSGKELIPLSEVANNPLRVEERVKKVSDGAGGIIDTNVKFPIWFDPTADNGTPMCEAFQKATGIIQNWLEQHPESFPPVVINITDGESTDGNPLK